MNPTIQELEHRADYERAVGHIVIGHPLPFTLLASSHIGFLAAAGRVVLKLYADAQRATWKAPFRPEERP